MISLSVPVIGHSTAPHPHYPTHWLHTSILSITSEETTRFREHSHAEQDKTILRSIYTDFHRAAQRVQTIFATDPTLALKELAELNSQLTTLLQ